VYDDISKKFVLEFTFAAPVKAVRLRRDKWVLTTCPEVMTFITYCQNIFMFCVHTGTLL
jgi:hypothetical protein